MLSLHHVGNSSMGRQDNGTQQNENNGLKWPLTLEKLCDAYHAGKLQFFGEHQALAETKTFTD